jgi:RNA polymerase sigma-70 factor (ECF subfamily)
VEGRPLDDAELVNRAKRGEVEAYEELVKRYQGIAQRLAYLKTGNATDAEDAAQSAFVKAYYGLARFSPDRPFRPWLLKIVQNEASNRNRSMRRQAALELRLAEDRPPGDAAPSAEGAVLGADSRRAVMQALTEMKERDRFASSPVRRGARRFSTTPSASCDRAAHCMSLSLGAPRSRDRNSARLCHWNREVSPVPCAAPPKGKTRGARP